MRRRTLARGRRRTAFTFYEMYQKGQILFALSLLLFVVFFNELTSNSNNSNNNEDHPQENTIRPMGSPQHTFHRAEFLTFEQNNTSLSIVVFGASGDLAARKIFPTLFALFCKGALPKRTNIIGYPFNVTPSSQLCERYSMASILDRLHIR